MKTGFIIIHVIFSQDYSMAGVFNALFKADKDPQSNQSRNGGWKAKPSSQVENGGNLEK